MDKWNPSDNPQPPRSTDEIRIPDASPSAQHTQSDGNTEPFSDPAYDSARQRAASGSPYADSAYRSYTTVRSPYDDIPPRRRRKRRASAGLIIFIVTLGIFVLLLTGGIAVYGLLRSDMGAALGLSSGGDATTSGENPIKPPAQSAISSATTAQAAATTVFQAIVDAPTIEILPAPVKTTAAPVYDENGMRVLTIKEIYDKVVPSVVGVVTTLDATYGGQSLGSGIIMSDDGFILTNAHVVENGVSYTVILNDKSEYTAALIGADKKSDIAILKIDADNLPAAEFGDSDALEVGDLAVAIGNPSSLDLSGTTTSGIISAIDRDIVVDAEGNKLKLIQTDAAINPGNSGGPLLNCYGQVIGINTVKLSSDTYEGLCFAIPTVIFKPIVDELLQYGQVSGYPTIGITGSTVDAYKAQAYRVPEGVYIVTVSEKSDAYAKGIQPGDIITAVNGDPVTSISDINLIKNTFKVGDTIILTIYRDTESTDYVIILMDEIELK
ncbi:MAG: trypsin-like peptidase domain-containing protein [Clostridiaceae bacterium]|nr:trypsin-like peptidase domain-containing protein [Clostridiaceae bacterium]